MKTYKLSRKNKALVNLAILMVIVILFGFVFNATCWLPSQALKHSQKIHGIYQKTDTIITIDNKNFSTSYVKPNCKAYLNIGGDTLLLSCLEFGINGWHVLGSYAFRCDNSENINVFLYERFGEFDYDNEILPSTIYCIGRVKNQSITKLEINFENTDTVNIDLASCPEKLCVIDEYTYFLLDVFMLESLSGVSGQVTIYNEDTQIYSNEINIPGRFLEEVENEKDN